MPTNVNPNPHGISSLSGWTKGGSSTTLTSTSEGARWVGGASGTGRYIRVTVPSSIADYTYYRVGNIAIRRNSGTARIMKTVIEGVGSSAPYTSTLSSFALGSGFVYFSTMPFTYPAVTITGGITVDIYAEDNKAFDFHVKNVGCYVNGDAPAPQDLDISDTQFSFTQADNSLIAAYTYTPGDEAVDQLVWNWGDGTANTTVAASAGPTSHTFPAPGIYNVKVTANSRYGDDGTTSGVTLTDTFVGATKAITVPVGPLEAHFSYETDFLNVVVDGASSVAPSVSPLDTYAWNWGDGNTTAANASPYASHTYAAPGTYNVTLTVNDTATARSDTEVRAVVATEAPNPDNYFVASRELLTVVFSPSIQGGTSYAWTFGDAGTSSAESPTHTYAAPGTYSVTLTVDGLSTTQDVTVHDVYTPLGSLLDALRLEVAIPYAAGTSYNRLPNPSGELGAWGWSTPVTNSYMTGSTTSHMSADKGIAGAKLIYRSSGAGTQVMYSTAVRVTVGQYASVQLQSPYVDGYYRATLEALDAVGAVIGSSATTGFQTASPTAVVRTTPYLLPALTATARVRLNHYSNTSSGTPAVNTLFQFRRVMLATAATSAELTGLPYAEYANWHDLLGPTSTIDVARAEMNLGTLTATVLDSAYDPAEDGRIRPGQGIRLRASTSDVSGNVSWQSIFTGTVQEADVEYVAVKGATPGPKSTRIKLSATDAVTVLTRVKEARGVAKIDELPELLEAAGVPFMVNGSTEQVPAAQVVGWNTNASVLDQVAVARDTDSGYAYVDRNNVLQIREPAYMPTAAAGVIDERAYSGISASFNTGDCINSVTIVWLRYTAAVGLEEPTTEEISYGPYEDAASIDEWGLRTATFTMQGIENPVTIAAKAAAILAANSQPARMISSVDVPIRHVEDLVPGKALLDLYDLVRLGYARTSTDELARVTSVRHRITARAGRSAARPFRWIQSLGFSADGVVASPQLTPSPPAAPTATPVTPAGHADISTATVSTAHAGTVTMALNRDILAPQGGVTRSGGTFTVTVPGIYLVTARARFASNAAGIRAVSIHKGGTRIAQAVTAGTAVSDTGCGLAIPVLCADGDTITGTTYQSSGGALNIVGGGSFDTGLAVLYQGP